MLQDRHQESRLERNPGLTPAGLTVVVACFDEERTLSRCIQRLLEKL
jgi:hypothetical protein